MQKDPRVQIASFELGGWDTHVNQPAILARSLRSLGQSLEGVLKVSKKAEASILPLCDICHNPNSFVEGYPFKTPS
jgi:hypothetical protein